MEIMKKIERHVEEHEVVDKVICDICGQDVDNEDDEITIRAKIGNFWPDVDCRDVYELDVCRNCFQNVKHVIEKTFLTKFRYY